MKLASAALIVATFAGPAIAQHHQHHQQQQPAPYAGMQQREIKALSGEQIADLRNGRGMGLALAAELNGYPGPMHVLQLKDLLRLTAEQQQKFQQLYDEMKAEAIAAGEALIENERALDRQFAEGRMTPDALSVQTSRIGEAQGRLRAVHLKYHLTSTGLLSADQRLLYAHLRGYR